MRGAAGTTGLGLVEIFDLAPAADSQLANISTRGLVQSGNNVLIGGLIIIGGEARVIVRAIGPSLGLTGQLGDSTLELFDQNGASLGTNDNWQSDQKTEILAAQLAPTRTAEAVLLRTLSPGAYTADRARREREQRHRRSRSLQPSLRRHAFPLRGCPVDKPARLRFHRAQ